MADKTHLYDLIKECFLLLDFGDRQFFEQFDLTVPRYYALTHIAGNPGLSPSVLSRYMFCDKSNITRLVQGLVNDGLVERLPHERDGRAQRLFLSRTGAILHERASLAHHHYVSARLTALDERMAGNFVEGLTFLNRSLSENLENIPDLSLN